MDNPQHGLPNGQKRDPPPAGAAPLRRVKPRADPLVARKKKAPQPTVTRPPPRGASIPPSNGAYKEPSVGPGSSKEEEKLREFEAKRAANGGWSQNPPVKDFKEYPVFTTKRALREGLRYHVMRFNRLKDDKPVDPTDQEQFPRPVSLHRRDPRLPPAGRVVVKEEPPPPNPVDEAEAERIRQLKAEKEAQRAIDMAQIAPVAKTSEPKPAKQTKRDKPVATYRPVRTEQAKKQQELRYEETLPWHLEDVEGKNVWVGSYVAALSETNVALVISGSGFRMIPLERYYKFNAKPAFNRLSLEEAERLMGKNATEVGRWVMKDKERAEASKEYEEFRKFLSGPSKVRVERDTIRPKMKLEGVDERELDMSGDEFQDDDENPGFEADDEDTKEARERMRRDHLAANNFGEIEEEEVEKEEELEKLQKMREKIEGKRIRRNLAKLEHAMEYSSDSDTDNPFAESSSESDLEGEKGDEKTEEAKQQTEEKEGATALAKGSLTPSSRQKALEQGKKLKSLKRPGSPNLSESSDNEISRKKKVKKSTATASVTASRSGTPIPGSRPKISGGAGSDTEATAGEGSDAGLKPKKKLKLKTGTGAKGTPVGSRAGSPAPAGQSGRNPETQATTPAGPSSATANRAMSPSKGDNTPRGSPPPGSPTGPVQAWEIVQALEARPEGISLSELLRMFSHRVENDRNPHLMKRQEWIALVRQNATYGPDKLVRPKPKATT